MNFSERSSIHNFVVGEQSLLGEEAYPYWNDLALMWQDYTGEKPQSTLSLGTNPRWAKCGYHKDAGIRMDKIYIKEAYPNDMPNLVKFWLFGKKVSDVSGYCASDHYGVAVELDFDNI